MAKKSKKNEKFNYNASVNALKAEGPAGLYLIWGPEDYLADRFFEEIKKQRLLVPAVFASQEQIANENKLMVEYLKTGANQQEVRLFFSNLSK